MWVTNQNITWRRLDRVAGIPIMGDNLVLEAEVVSNSPSDDVWGPINSLVRVYKMDLGVQSALSPFKHLWA